MLSSAFGRYFGASPKSDNLLLLLFVGAVTGALCAPFVRTILFLGDEGILLHGAQRMLNGDKLYRDFFEFYPPGGLIITVGWFWLIGTSFWSARILAISTVMGIACLLYLACAKTSKSRLLATVLALLWVVTSQGLWTQVNHHWFTTLISMLAFLAILLDIGHPTPRLAWVLLTGIAAGAAAMVTPTCGALVTLAAVATLTINRAGKIKIWSFAFGATLIPLSMLGYVAAIGSLAPAFYDVILFPPSRYSSIQNVPFGMWVDIQFAPLEYLFPVAGLLAIAVVVQNWRTNLQEPVFRACVLFGIAGFVGCYPRPDFQHIAFQAPLVCPLFSYCLSRLIPQGSRVGRNLAVIAMILICLPATIRFLWICWLGTHSTISPTARGAVIFFHNETGSREMIDRLAALPSTDGYFFYPYLPMMPFLTALRHVAKYDVFVPGYTSPLQYREACMDVMQYARWVVIDRSWTAEKLNYIFPAMLVTDPNERLEFERALEGAFEVVARDSDFELRYRTQAASTDTCFQIARP